ncbi:WAS/WASL-interacting protein family member 2-like [Limulus polyphemus]|uniref:WAS/WASL-interacting protein family member 2-like n=1 Tax=Limulus polyphemus TaxID=6850 RepID=A0ABM1TGN8_LIMPO|nr:WAS/WASL-interacting protein family member 2-like [Limulus polyphemus]XP_022255044.1 WAS/WASL-interacting protein family member 2-like [Limulus polyphemus]XP_022255045.1 WAS/WASL-interacting protein family member 2-like [Limulus polyphemus]
MPSPVAKNLTKAPSSVPPPPPPPPPPPGTDGMPTWREKQRMANRDYESSSPRTSQRNANNLEDDTDQQYSNLPSKLYGTLKKDKKPFTYTPGGIDLSEIRSPRMAKRIIANQQDPGVAAKPKPPGALVQAEVHTPENRVPSQTIPTRQPVLPVMINQQPVLPPLSNPSYSTGPKLTPQKQKVDAYPTEYVDESYNTQRENTSRQLQGLNLANNEKDPYYFEPPEQYPKTLPPSHGIRHDLDSQEPRNFGQSRSFRVLQKITSTDESDAQKESYDNPEQLDETVIEPRYKGGNIPSYAFKILQEMTGSNEGEVPQSPSAVHPNRRASKTQMHVLDPQQPLPPKQFPHPEVPASQLPSEPEPKKYTGGSIPSRSFRMLQTMTGGDPEATGPEGTDF